LTDPPEDWMDSRSEEILLIDFMKLDSAFFIDCVGCPLLFGLLSSTLTFLTLCEGIILWRRVFNGANTKLFQGATVEPNLLSSSIQLSFIILLLIRRNVGIGFMGGTKDGCSILPGHANAPDA
jgi:hypothetical protein